MIQRSSYLKLLTIINQVEVKALAEVGVWFGMNAWSLRSIFPEAHLYLIDPWKPTHEYFVRGFSPPTKTTTSSIEYFEDAYQFTKELFKNQKNTTIIRKTSMDSLPDIPDNLDLVFIDGDHSYEAVKKDILGFEKKVRVGGLLTGHDYAPRFPGVVQAVQEIYPGRFQVGDDSVWSIIKT